MVFFDIPPPPSSAIGQKDVGSCRIFFWVSIMSGSTEVEKRGWVFTNIEWYSPPPRVYLVMPKYKHFFQVFILFHWWLGRFSRRRPQLVKLVNIFRGAHVLHPYCIKKKNHIAALIYLKWLVQKIWKCPFKGIFNLEKWHSLFSVVQTITY